MNFLIDECLHTSLVEVAEERGHEATHVTYRGLSGVQDWNLIGSWWFCAALVRQTIVERTGSARPAIEPADGDADTMTVGRNGGLGEARLPRYSNEP